MLKYAAFFAVLGFAWSQSSTPSAPLSTGTAAATGSTASPGYKFFYDKYYHQVVMVTKNACYFHQLRGEEKYDANDAAGLKAIETKILTAERKLQEFGTEINNRYFYSYNHLIREACRGLDTYQITSNA